MSSFVRALRAEALRLLGPRVLLLVPLGALGAAAYAWVLGATVEAGVLGARSGYYLAAAAASAAALACAAIGALSAASGVASDFASGLVRAIVTRPIARAPWIAARVLALGLGMNLVFLACCAGALAAGLLRFGAGGAREGDYVIASAGFLAGELAGAIALSLLAQLAAVALGGALGALVRRTGAAITAVVLGAAGLLALGRVRAGVPLSPLPAVTEGLDRVALLAQGLAGHAVGEGAAGAVLASLVWITLALGLAGRLVARRDIVT